jgi:hypothetical protein
MKQAALRALAAQREREEEVAKAQMAAALGGGVSWGFGEDAVDDDADRRPLPFFFCCSALCVFSVSLTASPGARWRPCSSCGAGRPPHASQLFLLMLCCPSPPFFLCLSVEDVDWRAYAATRGLSEKQQKLADKIRKREARVQHLQREIDKIKAGSCWLLCGAVGACV